MSIREAREVIQNAATLAPPTVGRVVHFVDEHQYTGDVACRAAVISHVWAEGDPELDQFRNSPLYEVDEIEPVLGVPGAEWVALHVMIISGCAAIPFACHDENTKLGKTWHWPERQA